MSRPSTSVFSRTPILFVCALISCALWGSAIPVIKRSYALFAIDTANPGALLLFAGVRFAIAGVMVFLMGSLMQRRWLLPKKTDWGRVVIVAAFQTVIQYLLYYIGLNRTTGVTASILVGTNTFFAILLSSLVFRMEKLTAGKALGCLIGFAGVVLVQLGGDSRFHFSGAEAMVLMSTISGAAAAVLIGRYSAHMSPVTLSGWQFFLGGLVLTGAGLAMGGTWGVVSPASIATLLYLAFVSAMAYTLWGLLLKHNSVSRVTVFGFLTPVFGVLISSLLLGESIFGLRSSAALALVCVGIVAVNRASGTAN